MALVVKDRVQETTTVVGTGTMTLDGAVLGFQTFAIIGNSNTTYYAVADAITGDWEVGIGTYTLSGTTLSRTTVLESSNAGALVNFAAGSKNVFCTYPAERSVYLDSAGSYPVQSTFNAITAASIALTTGTITTAPAVSDDIANKFYVDSIAALGIVYHEPVFVESPVAAGNLNATYNQPGGAGDGVGATLTNAGTQVALTIDGVLMTTGKRVLIHNQTSAFQNGVYTVTTVGTVSTNWVLTRATDADTYAVNSPDSLGQGDAFYVQAGDTGASNLYAVNTVGTITFGTTAITFALISAAFPYLAGTGLNLSPATTFNISNVGTAGTYGSSSNVPVFVTNAQGQVTSVTNTGIAITSAAVSGLAASATTDTTNAANITTGTLPAGRIAGTYSNLTGTGALAAGSLATGFTAVSAPLGGTGLSSYTIGDLIYADTSTSFAKLADVAVGNALISGGVGSAPSWGKIGAATHIDGTLPVLNGGTSLTSLTANNVILGNGTGAPLFVSPATSGNVLTANGTTWISAPAGGGGGLTYVYKTANYTAASNEGVLCDTLAGDFTVTLPATPAVGVQVIVADAGGAWGTNNLTVDRNGSLIAGLAENLVCDIASVSVQLVYDGTSWEVYAQIGVNGGTLVTLNDIQTLTNKDLTSATNTFPTSLATLVGAQTLTNKTIAFANNTLTGVQAELVSGSNIKTINGTTLLGAGDLVVASGILTINNKVAAYTVVAGDLGKVINCTSGTFTVSLTAAATLGAGFNVTIWNTSATSTDVITIDAFASETIDGLQAVILRRGEGMEIVSDGSNWQTGNKKVMRAYAENMLSTAFRPTASGNGALAISSGGLTSIASNSGAINIGGGTSSGTNSLGILGSPSGTNSTAIGLNNGSQYAVATGSGAVSLGGSYASGTDTFAAVIGTSSSSYGTSNSLAIAMGYIAKAAYASVAIGARAVASVSNSISICSSYSSFGNVSSGFNSITLGDGNAAAGTSSVAWGFGANARYINGKQVWAGGSFNSTNAEGSSQTGQIVLRGATTTAIAAVMSSDTSAASTINQVILPNDSTFIFRGQLVARNTGSDTDSMVWEFKGGIRRGTSAGTTTLIGTPSIDLIASDGSAWTVALTADTTNGGLAVTVTGEAAKTIRWVATVRTTEVTG
jgi:hypothetical protein